MMINWLNDKMSDVENLLSWLRGHCDNYKIEPIAVFRKGLNERWPLIANSEIELQQILEERGHFSPLPKEPAALANIIEVSLIDYLIEQCEGVEDISLERGTERGYPDLEITGSRFGNNYFAIDIKAARRKVSNANGKVNRKKTQSRITLYTGNTYFRYPSLKWPGMFRPFQDYKEHLDIIAIYTLDHNSKSRIIDLELIVQEAWRIGSKHRSSTTREYLGAVDDIDRLRDGSGDFENASEFYKYWRSQKFKTGVVVDQQLKKLLARK